MSATFYASLGSQVPGLDTDDAAVRTTFPPLNQPTGQVPPDQAEAARNASVDAFHVASIAAIVLLIGGAAANQFGLRGAGAVAGVQAEQQAPAPAAEPAAGRLSAVSGTVRCGESRFPALDPACMLVNAVEQANLPGPSASGRRGAQARRKREEVV